MDCRWRLGREYCCISQPNGRQSGRCVLKYLERQSEVYAGGKWKNERREKYRQLRRLDVNLLSNFFCYRKYHVSSLFSTAGNSVSNRAKIKSVKKSSPKIFV